MLQDLRYAVRSLRKAPLFTAVAVFSLALGIGANTAIFTLINQLILQLLPVQHPEELVLLTARGSHYGSNTGANSISYPMYQDFRDKNEVFRGMFCRYGELFSLTTGGRTELVTGELVSGNYFPVLGVGAALGRVFTAQDDLIQGGHPLAVLGYGFWKTRFGGDPGVLGKRIVVDGYPLTIVGVSQAGFEGVEPGSTVQIRVPMMMKKEVIPGQFYSLNNRRGRFVQAFARLKPGMTLEHAKAGLQPLFHQMLQMEVQQKEFGRATEYTKQQFLKMSMDVLPASKGRSFLRQQFYNPLLALMAIVALVLLIACSNVANLLIARATARQKEIAVRLALGAGRRRLIGQLLEESVLLSAAGGAAGLGLAVLMDKALIGFLPVGVTAVTLTSTPDLRVLGFTLAVSVVTGLIFGLAPAIQSTRPELAGTLKDQAGAVVGGTSVMLRKSLVVAQVALSLLLLIGAGLFVQSLKNLKGVNPGFRTENLVSFSVDPLLNGYKDERCFQFYRQLTDRLTQLPGVTSAALAIMPVLDGNEWDSTYTVEGYTAKQGEWVDPHMQFVSPGFFATLGIGVLLGRDFTLRDDRRDDKGAPKVGIVNERFAKRYFGGANPLGRHVGNGGDPGAKLDIEIVGVVKDTRYESMRDEVPYELYLPYRQMPFVQGMTAYLRAQGDPEGLFPTLRQLVREVDSNVPVYRMRTLEQQVDKSLVTERMLAMLATVFGCLATVLAAVGLYGVMAYMVVRRTREIGIRMALGASGGSVIWLVMREVMLLAAVGVTIGLPAAWAVTRLIQTQLFGIDPADVPTMALAAFGIASVALLSGYLPARRAIGIDPMRALRWE
ncbi:MAG TPA: ABC transporter permease [Candidatus Acidoferrales bacterium]|nr:ABC transporter permease [Candidatus Acidoferrales bacterium]